MNNKLKGIVNNLIQVNELAFKLFQSKRETRKWLYTPNTFFFGSSPVEVVLSGNGKHLVSWLKERSGYASNKKG